MSARTKRPIFDADIFIASRIREIRRLRKLPLSFVADEIGISFQQLRKYEIAENRISVGMFLNICKVLKINPSEVIGFINNGSKSDSEISHEHTAIESAETIILADLFGRIKDRSTRNIIISICNKFSSVD